MEEAALSVVVNLQDNASASLQALNSTVAQTGTTSATVQPKVTSLSTTLASNRMAIRELAMGVTYLGSTFVGLGVAMASSNNQSIKSMGSTVAMIGGIMSAIGASVQFISAIAKMTDALKKLQMAEILTQAFSGPAGWVALGAGVAVAGAAVAGVSMYERSQSKANTQINHNIHVNVQGSVTTEKNLTDQIRKNLVLTQNRNGNTTGIK